MVDFSKFVGKTPNVDYRDPIAIHKRLDSAVSHSHLRDVQREALEAFAVRRSERDLVLKMSTGSGKTTVGLLMLKSYMAETKRPGVYLCPTRQLVQQVISEAEKLGLKAEEYTGAHPSAAVIRGETVSIAAYEKLFNARSTFERDDVQFRPVAIVLDDAHAGIERIRAAFTINWSDSSPVYGVILGLVEDSLRQQHPGRAESIQQKDPRAVAEVPYWTWQTHVGQITRKLAEEADGDTLRFKWGFVRDDLNSMRCIISGCALQIAPDVVNIRVVPAYHHADHRIFMSATLADDSLLVRELDCDPDAALNPIMPTADRGLGERMVLVPTLFGRNSDRQSIQGWLGRLSKQINVVVLAPSFEVAQNWAPFGALPVRGDDVDSAIAALRNGTHKFVAIANRYDGIDLPDAACRVIVIDGLPRGDSLFDAWERELSPNSPDAKRAHRIEQGMGRAVRSPSDYAIAILLGNDIEAFVAKAHVLQVMGRETQAQIHLAHRLVELAQEDQDKPVRIIHKLAVQCLNRDPGWKEFYRQEVVCFSASGTEIAEAQQRVKLASAERRAFHRFLDGECDEAHKLLLSASDECAKDDESKARLFQRAARYMSPVDRARALELQKKAREWNSRLFKPLTGVKYCKHASATVREADRVLQWMSTFEHANAAIAAVRDLRDRLAFGNDVETFEAAVRELGEVLGTISERPEREYGEGPDNAWIFAKAILLIEAKNNSQAECVPKRDVGQLHNSLEWGKQHYPELNCVGLLWHRQVQTDSSASPSNDMKVVTPELLDQLMNAVEAFVVQLTELSPTDRAPGRLVTLMNQHGLTWEALLSRYTRPLRKG